MASALPPNWSSADVEAARKCSQEISVITLPFTQAFSDACDAFTMTKEVQDCLDDTNVEDEDYDDDITEFSKHEVFANNIQSLMKWNIIVKSVIASLSKAITEYNNMRPFIMSANVPEVCQNMFTAEKHHLNRMVNILMSDYYKMCVFEGKIATFFSKNERAIEELERDFPCTRRLGIV